MNTNIFLRNSLHFDNVLAIFEPPIYVVVEQLGTENISLLSGRLVRVRHNICQKCRIIRYWAVNMLPKNPAVGLLLLSDSKSERLTNNNNEG